MTRDEYDQLLKVMNAKVEEFGSYSRFWLATYDGDDETLRCTLDGDYAPAQLRQIAEWFEHLQKMKPA